MGQSGEKRLVNFCLRPCFTCSLEAVIASGVSEGDILLVSGPGTTKNIEEMTQEEIDALSPEEIDALSDSLDG